jgi:hypothetical protein
MEEAFVIDNDVKAEWALRKIRERAAERDRIVETSTEIIESYKAVIKTEVDRAADELAVLEGMLQRDFEAVEPRATKTRQTYRLPTGKLKMKLAFQRMVPDTEALMAAFPAFVEHKPDLRWGELKKRLDIIDGKAVDTETGEIVEGVSVETVPPKFIVEV